jgi:hypothetical protein
VSAPVPSSQFTASSARPEREERRDVRLQGFAVLADGSTVTITLLDLSYEGCAIAIPVELTPGDPISLSVLRRGGIKAEVRWFKDGKAGLAFDTGARPDAKTQWPRRSERVGVTAEVTMRRHGGPNFRVNVFDASPDGCKIDFVDRPLLDERLSIRFEGLEALEAEVCWVEQHCAGLKFARAIHPAVFDLLIERLRV